MHSTIWATHACIVCIDSLLFPLVLCKSCIKSTIDFIQTLLVETVGMPRHFCHFVNTLSLGPICAKSSVLSHIYKTFWDDIISTKLDNLWPPLTE